jgi:hypothetical protein
MRFFCRSLILGAVVASSVFVSHPLVNAQEKKPAESKGTELLAAEKILDRYAEVTGGKKLESVKSRVSEGTFSVPAAGMNGDMMIQQAAPNKFYMKIDLPAIGGAIEQGTDGSEAWEKSVLSGTRVLTGPEKDAFLLRAAFTSDLNWREHYKTFETTGSKKIGEKDCWVVELTTEGSDKPMTNFYSKESGLLERTKMTLPTPQGEIEMETDFSDYKDVEGFPMPFTSTISMLGQKQVLTIKTVVYNGEIDETLFAKPVKKKKKVE